MRALYSGVSRGTEALVFRGEVPPSEYSVMRAPFQEGEFPGPVKYGYASVGRVEDARGDPSLERLVGRLVFCLHPHEDLYAVPGDAVLPLPDDLPAERAVLGASMETAVNVVWDAEVTVGDRVVVVGAGVVGLLAAHLASAIPGARVTAVDPRPASRSAAEELGVEAVPRLPEEGTADAVIHASGSPGGLSSALAAAGPEATVVEASWFGDREVPAPLGGAFHPRRLRIRSSQVGSLPPARAPRWTSRQRLALALDLLCDPRVDRLVNSESSFEELPGVMERLSRHPGDTLCHRVRYPVP